MFSFRKIISAVSSVSMKKISCWLLVVSCWFVCALPANADALKLPTVTVMADHPLSIAVSEIARNYSRENQVVVNSSFLPQKIQQEQISGGAAADILITSKAEWIDQLKLQGLIDIHSQTKFARDRLVLIGAKQTEVVSTGAGRFPAFEIIKAGNGEPVFVLGNPEFLMEGIYSKEAMRSFGANDDLEPYTLYVKRLDEMFDMVANQNAFALCFYSSIANRNDIKIIDTLPESSHKPIIYNAVVIASDNMNEARKFLAYLKSAEVRKLLVDDGFVVD